MQIRCDCPIGHLPWSIFYFKNNQMTLVPLLWYLHIQSSFLKYLHIYCYFFLPFPFVLSSYWFL
jgi:hypothetical protein